MRRKVMSMLKEGLILFCLAIITLLVCVPMFVGFGWKLPMYIGEKQVIVPLVKKAVNHSPYFLIISMSVYGKSSNKHQ